MILFIVKMQERELENFKNQMDPSALRDDIRWAAEDILLDETTLQNYIKAARTMNILEESYTITFFGSPLYTSSLVSDDVVIDSLRHQFDPNNEWDILKFLTVRPEAEPDVRNFFDKQEIDYDVVVL